LVNYFAGLFPDLRINNAYYPLSTKEQTTQLAQPDGLGAELITQSVLENPAVKGSQWTYLGNGRWQYVGDGTLNELIPIFPASQPNQGYLEFEIESITGSITCSQNSLARTVFNSVGVKRYFYTDRNEGGTNGASVSFKRALGTVASCIIKNISFKPLGTANPLTLFNTVPEQWEQISCSIRDDGRLTPAITEQPQDISVATGSVATFSTLATVPEGEVTYQWQEDDGAGFTDIAAATSPTLNLGIVTALANGKLVRAQVTANGRSVVSRSATLTVTL
jgi:hypothetical protein